MPRLQDKLQDLIVACEARRRRCEALRQAKQHAWVKAKRALEAHNSCIKKTAQLLRVKNLGASSIIGELTEVLNGNKPVDPGMPTPGAVSRAKKKKAPAGYRPKHRTGAEAILKALLSLETRYGRDTWHEFAAVKREANPHSEYSMFTAANFRGKTAWAGNKTLVEKRFIERDEGYKQFHRHGRFGARPGRVRLTALGRQKATEWYVVAEAYAGAEAAAGSLSGSTWARGM